MTATDELRRLLDERGVEWGAEESELDHVTTWNANGGQAMFYESKTTNPNLLQVNYYDLTPEQAVEATLGSEAEVENTWLKETYGYLSGMFEAEVAENAKLRELVRSMKAVIWAYDEYTSDDDCPPAIPLFEDRLHELGIEVDA